MKNVTLEEACKNVREKMKEDIYFRFQYENNKNLLEVIFKENVDEVFYEYKSEEEVLIFVKDLLSNEFIKNNVEIEKIEIIPDKTVLVRGNNNLDIDEANAIREIERNISLSIKAFTGYFADVSL